MVFLIFSELRQLVGCTRLQPEVWSGDEQTPPDSTECSPEPRFMLACTSRSRGIRELVTRSTTFGDGGC